MTTRRALSAVAGTGLVLALAGCGTRRDPQVTSAAYEVSVGDALAVTGLVLLVPIILLAVVFFVMGIDYEYSWTRTEVHKRIAKIALVAGCALLGLACIFWISAIWMSVTA